MAIQKTEKIWHNGKLIPWDEAQLHVMSHVVNYGSSVFEGVRCYSLPKGPAIFRASEHMQRLLDSAKIYRIDVDSNGYVSECSGENIFVVRNGTLQTAPLGNSVLPGITRDSVMQIARDLGIPVVEQVIPREMLYIADEAFFTGTAAEVTAIRSVDKISVGKGVVGPITRAIQKEFYAIIRGEKTDRFGWLTAVPVGTKQPVSV